MFYICFICVLYMFYICFRYIPLTDWLSDWVTDMMNTWDAHASKNSNLLNLGFLKKWFLNSTSLVFENNFFEKSSWFSDVNLFSEQILRLRRPIKMRRLSVSSSKHKTPWRVSQEEKVFSQSLCYCRLPSIMFCSHLFCNNILLLIVCTIPIMNNLGHNNHMRIGLTPC